MFDISSLIDPLSELIGKVFSGFPHSRGANAADVSDALDAGEAVDEIEAIDTLEVTNVDIDTEELGSEIVDDVDALASLEAGEGVDMSQVESSGSGTASGPEKRYKQYRVPFGSALGCNICSCKCYVGGDGTSSVCICGHQKWQHKWG